MKQVKRIPMMPYVVSIDEIGDVAAPEVLGFEEVSDAFYTKVFDYIPAGKERICIVLRADGLTYKDIGWVMGISLDEVHRLIYKVRNRFQEMNINRNNLTNLP